MKRLWRRMAVGLAAVVISQSVFAAQQTWEQQVGTGAAAIIATIRVAKTSRTPAAAYQPQALKGLLQSVDDAAKSGKKPIVIFDLDDTLIDTAYRHMAIIREFGRSAAARQSFPREAAKMSAIRYEEVRYDLADTLAALGIAEPAVLPALKGFWAARFFENDYLLFDRANKGAVDYVKKVLRRGGIAVYLTGRWQDMRPGTEASMERMGLPKANGTTVILMMKPVRTESDLDFKKRAFDQIAALGEVAGGFENEPQNVNAYEDRFPQGTMIFLDTRHSKTQAAPFPDIAWVPDFRY